MTVSNAKESASQALQGPYLVSYGDVQAHLIKCKRRIKLTENESDALGYLVHTMARPKYMTVMSDVVREESKDISSMTGMSRQSINRAFNGLVKKGVIRAIKSIGESTHYYLSPQFIDDVVLGRFSEFVDNSSDCHQNDDTTVIRTMTHCHQNDDTTVIRTMTHCHQNDDSAYYIETPLSLNLPSLPRRNPAVDNVDNSNDRISIVAKLLGSDNVASEKFLTRVKPAMFEKFDLFLSDCSDRGLSGIGDKQAGLGWARFFYKEDG